MTFNQVNESLVFAQFFTGGSSSWQTASMEDKEFEVHDYMNLECGCGVFTDVKNETEIHIFYSDEQKTVIDATLDLESFSDLLEKFMDEFL